MQHPHAVCSLGQLRDLLDLICEASCKAGTVKLKRVLRSAGLAGPRRPAADGHCAAGGQEVVHAVPPAPLKTALSEQHNTAKTFRLETGQSQKKKKKKSANGEL